MTGCASQVLGNPKWDQIVVWHKYLAVAFIWMVRPIHPEFALGKIHPMVKKITNPPLLGGNVLFSTCTIICPLFFFPLHWPGRCYGTHTANLTKFTQLVFSWQSLSLLNTEMSLMWKTVLQNRMILDIITVPQGGTYAIIQTECCAFIPDEFANVSFLLNLMRTEVNTEWFDLQPRGLKSMAWITGFLVEKLLLSLRIIILICVSSCMCFSCCCGVCLQYSQIATKWAPPMLVKPPLDCSGHNTKEGCIYGHKSQSWGLEGWVRTGRRHSHSWLESLTQTIGDSLPTACSWNMFPTTPTLGAVSRMKLWESKRLLRPSGLYPVKAST